MAIRGGPTPGGGCTPALLGAGPSMAIGLWATGLPLATYWPSGEGPLATDWPPTPTGLPLRGGHTPLWPLTGHWLHHTGSGEPLSGHRAKTPLANFGHTLREAQLHGQKGGGPSPTGHLLAIPLGTAPLRGAPTLASPNPTDFATPTNRTDCTYTTPHPPTFPHWEKCGETHNRLGESDL